MSEGKTKTVNFNKEGIENLPEDKPVVYKIKDKKGENIYTGSAKRGRIEERLKEHLPKGIDSILGGTKVQILQKKSIDEAKIVESNIIARSKPKYNKKGK